MSVIDIQRLIEYLPGMMDAVLPGFILLGIYNWILSKKNMDITKMVLWSIFISFIIRTAYQAIGLLILPEIAVPGAIKSLVYIATGSILPFVLNWLRGTNFFTIALDRVSHKSINDDLWKDIINYSEPTMMRIFLKGADIMYAGKFVAREENGLESWIVLTTYVRTNKENEPQYNPGADGKNSMVALNMRDIERIEIIYREGSTVWQKYNGVEPKECTCNKASSKTNFNSRPPTAREVSQMLSEATARKEDQVSMKIKISEIFTDAPGGRLRGSGAFSGQEFREDCLTPTFIKALEKKRKLLVDLDGCYGISTSFIDEAFGGLALTYGKNTLDKYLELKCDDEPGLARKAWTAIEEWDKKR